MNPKQLACVVLMALIGVITYAAQIVHKKVAVMKKSAEDAKAAAVTADDARQMAEIQTATTKANTEEIRNFLKAWTPHIDRVQTEQEVSGAIEFSLRDRGISLVSASKTEVRTARENKVIPKSVLASLVIEDEYSKVLNWLGDVEKRLPLARVKATRISGGSTPQQLRMDVSLEVPLVNLASEALEDKGKTKGKKKA